MSVSIERVVTITLVIPMQSDDAVDIAVHDYLAERGITPQTATWDEDVDAQDWEEPDYGTDFDWSPSAEEGNVPNLNNSRYL